MLGRFGSGSGPSTWHSEPVPNNRLRLGDIVSDEAGKGVAQGVVDQLSGRLVLTEDPEREDYESCRQSISDIRHYLSAAATSAAGSPDLRQSLLRMREACLNFLRAAGQHSELFVRDHALFVAHLTLWRLVIAQEVHWMFSSYGVELTPDLRALPAK